MYNILNGPIGDLLEDKEELFEVKKSLETVSLRMPHYMACFLDICKDKRALLDNRHFAFLLLRRQMASYTRLEFHFLSARWLHTQIQNKKRSPECALHRYNYITIT